MTAFAAIISNENLTQKEQCLFGSLVGKIRSQITGFDEDHCQDSHFRASKLWLGHARTSGLAREKETGSWLGCVGNPGGEKYLELSSQEFHQVLLRDYLLMGPSAIQRLNAPFVVVVYDGRDRSMNIFSDRIGLGHLYLSQYNHSYILSSSSLALASVVPVTLNRKALVQYFLIGHLLQDCTLFEEIKKIEGATWLKIVKGRIQERRYWSAPEASQKRVNDAESIAELDTTYKKVMTRCLSSHQRTSIELTGGLDSRFNLAAAMSSDKEYFAWTIGLRGSAEVAITEQLSRLHDYNHLVVHPVCETSDQFIKDLEQITVLTDGEVNSLNLIASPSCNRETASLRDASVSGVGGELLRGFYYLSHAAVNHKTNDVQIKRLIHWQMLPNISVQPDIFSKVFPSNYHALLEESVQHCFLDTSDAPLFWRLDDFYLRARMQRLGGRTCSLNNYFYRPEVPYFSNEILDLSFRLPWQLKKHSCLIKKVLSQCHPDLAAVPMLNGLPARPLSMYDLHYLCRYYMGLSGKVWRKLQYHLLGKAVKVSDDVGIRALVNNALASKEVKALLKIENMASGFLYDANKFEEYLRDNEKKGFVNNYQMGLILSFELACRQLGSSMKV